MKERKYRPSNGTEGRIFMGQFCENCIHDKNQDCKILAYSMAFDVDEKEYPKEWIYDKKGNSICTSYEEK